MRRPHGPPENLDLFGKVPKADAMADDTEGNSASPIDAPLAERMRPQQLAEMVGQDHVLGTGSFLRQAIERDRVPSLLLWGPPGTGKTTLAQVVARDTRARFVTLSAVTSGVADIRRVVTEANEIRRRAKQRTLLFVDEIHHFNKSQQDALLPHVENGTLTLIGATTENPSFAVNAALLSRARVVRLEGLNADAIRLLLQRALEDESRGLGALGLQAEVSVLDAIATATNGDAREALGHLQAAAEQTLASDSREITLTAVQQSATDPTLLYDKRGEEHYNVISAFIKSMRGSDPDAAVYWMMRMLQAGEDPRFVLRRMLIFASEDIGTADPQALSQAVAADQAFHRLGMPEAMFALSQCCIYLATAPKSNACYRAWKQAQEDVRAHGALGVPLKLRNAPTTAMQQWGYGKDYRYAHDAAGGYVPGEVYLPDALAGTRYYEPSDRGQEARIGEHLAQLRARKPQK